MQQARPNKRVYELTAAGPGALAAWVDRRRARDRAIRDDFFMKLALARWPARPTGSASSTASAATTSTRSAAMSVLASTTEPASPGC